MLRHATPISVSIQTREQTESGKDASASLASSGAMRQDTANRLLYATTAAPATTRRSTAARDLHQGHFDPPVPLLTLQPRQLRPRPHEPMPPRSSPTPHLASTTRRDDSQTTTMRRPDRPTGAVVRLDSTLIDSPRLARLDYPRFDSVRLDSTRFDSTRFNSSRLDSPRLVPPTSVQLDPAQLLPPTALGERVNRLASGVLCRGLN